MPRDPGRAVPPAPADLPDPGPRVRPAAAGLLGLEAVLLLAVAGAAVVLVSGGGLDPRFGAGLVVVLVLFGGVLLLAARSLLARGRFGLGWGVTWQLFQALVGASLVRGGLLWQGGLTLVLAVGAFLLLLRLVRSTPLPGGDR